MSGKEDTVNLRNEEFSIICSSSEEGAELINHEGVDVFNYINLEKHCIESLADEEMDNEKLLRIPTLDELFPYNLAIHEYVEDMEIPVKETASHYLRRNNLMQEFQVFRQEKAIDKLNHWFKERKIRIVLEDE